MESVNKTGTFSDISCPRLLVNLHLASFTGTLRISQGALLKLLYFQNGSIAMASSNDQGDHLAPILMRSGKLKSEQLELARKQTQPGISLARVLVKMGFLTSGELFAGARQQLRQIVGSILGLSEGRYEIQKDYFPREITSLNVDTRELLLDLIAEIPERSFVLLEVGAPDSVYAPSSAAAGRVSLPKAWQGHADRFAGPMTIHALGQSAGLDDFAASKAVYALHLFGFLEQRSQEPSASTPEVVLLPEIDTPEAEEEAAGPLPPDGDRAGTAVTGRVESLRDEGVPGTANRDPDRVAQEPALRERPLAASSQEADFVSIPAIREAPRTDDDAPGQEEVIARNEPIRMEFKGVLSSPKPPARSSGPWGILSIIAGIAILAAAFAGFIFLKGSPAPGDVSPSSPGKEEPPPQASPPESEPAAGGQAAPQAATAATSEAALNGPAAAATVPPAPAEGAPPSSPDAGAPAMKEAPPGRDVPTAPPGNPPASAPAGEPPGQITPAAESGETGSPFSRKERFSEGRGHLDQGDFAAAGRIWLEMARQEEKDGFTVQFAIACQEESVKKAARRTRGSAEFFILPFSLQDKPCYRLCWGAYPSEEEARAAKGSVPSFFLSEGGNPVVISMKKLSPPEKR
jgi:uncharacterized protein DUF4388